MRVFWGNVLMLNWGKRMIERLVGRLGRFLWSAGWEDGCHSGLSMPCHEPKEGSGDSDPID